MNGFESWRSWLIALVGSSALLGLVSLVIFAVKPSPKVEIGRTMAAVDSSAKKPVAHEPAVSHEDQEHQPSEKSHEAPEGKEQLSSHSESEPDASHVPDTEAPAESPREVLTEQSTHAVGSGEVACSAGRSQSPINIERPMVTRELRPLIFTYSTDAELKITGRGPKRQIACSGPCGSLRLQSTDYPLKSIAMKFPSEHMVDGEQFAAELQFHHTAKQTGKEVVLAVLLRSGSASGWPDQLLNAVTSEQPFDLTQFIPTEKSYYEYEGSHTEPPCNEGVTWIILKKPIFAADEALRSLRDEFGADARPLQAVNQRRARMSSR